MKIIVLKGVHIISEFTYIIYNELKQYYDVEYKDKYDPNDKEILHFIISPQEDNNMPNRYIIYNLEPMNYRSKKHNKHNNHNKYIEKIRKAEIVWEYSKTNLSIIKKLNKNIIYKPFFYSKFMEKLYNIQNDREKDIDVLFYGLMNSRRNKIIEDLKKEGINIYSPNYPENKPVWLKDKFDLIKRSKIVINIHYHSELNDQTNDLLRIMFLLANKVVVVQEETNDKDIDEELKEIIVPYDGIVKRCKELLIDNQNIGDKMYNIVKTKMFLNLNGTI